ncbi:MAG: hypothetical protein JNK87_19085, partial [Bryobacterales bacterium]|nr:hypothetical protein [Bryobacterales bacterium]
KPYDIREWELLEKTNFSYTQPWYLPTLGRFLFRHTLYKNGQRTLNFKASADARTWPEPTLLAHIEMGDYQVSWRDGDTSRVATAFDLHPSTGRAGKGLNYRTNLYYAETGDAGQTWTNAAGDRLNLPLLESVNPALVHDYRAEDRNVYMKDIAFENGQPVLLYLTSKGFEPGEASGPYQWFTARYTGKAWDIRPAMTSDHNYDHGSLYIEAPDLWRVIAPTAPGPQPWGTGGDVVMWTSTDEGRTWKSKPLTKGSRYNHTYVRKPVNAHPGFYAIWADGSPLEPTPSSLYFCTKNGEVFRLPTKMTADTAKPERVR